MIGLLAGSLLPSQARDEIVVRGSSKFDLFVGQFGGDSGSAVRRDLMRVLESSGYFRFAPAAPGNYAISGAGLGNQVDGILAGPQGQSLFRRGYRKTTLRANVHALADDIIEAIAGVPGITSSKIVFVGRQGGRKEIFQCGYDGSGVVQLTQDGSISVSPSVSPDGSYVAYTSYMSGYPDIYTIDLVSRSRKRIVNAPGTNGGAAISPNGRDIACTLSFTGNKELYIVNRHGGRPRSLTRTAWTESSPTWSPNGSEIIYCSDQTGRPQLYRVSVRGGAPQRVNVPYGYCTEPSWSPDGNLLAFSAKSGGLKIVVFDFRTGRSRIIRAGEDPSWAPDSRHLAFASGGALYRANVATGAVVRLAANVGGISEPSWSR